MSNNMNVDVRTKDDKGSNYFEDLNHLKKSYKHVRDNFLNTFGKFYCCRMNIPCLSTTLKICNHNNISLKLKHCELVMYMKNIILWLDPKMDYNIDHIINVIPQRNIITSNECTVQQLSQVPLYSQVPNLNKDTNEQTRQSLKSLTYTDENISNNKILPQIIEDSTDKNFVENLYTDTSKNDLKKNSNKVKVFLSKPNMFVECPTKNVETDYIYDCLNHNKVDNINKTNVITLSKEKPDLAAFDMIFEDLINGTSDVNIFSNSQINNIDSDGCSNYKKEENSVIEKILDIKTITAELDCMENNTDIGKEKLNLNQTIYNINDPNVSSNLCANISEIKVDSISIKNELKNLLNIKRSNSVLNSEHIPKRKKIDQSHINHTRENISINDKNISEESMITTTFNTNLKKETLVTDNLNCLIDEKKNMPKKIKVTKKRNYKPRIVGIPSRNVQLKEILKQEKVNPKNNISEDGIISSLSNNVQLEKTPIQEKVDTKNNNSSEDRIVGNQENVQLKKTPKQEKVKTSNDSIKKIVKNMYSRNSKGETKMHIACAKGNLNLVTSLLAAGFNPNVKDNAGWTPLHEAVKNGCLEIVEELIYHGAYINVPGFEYITPLHVAVNNNNYNIATFLIQFGADLNSLNIYGHSLRCLNEQKMSLISENNISVKYTSVKIEQKYKMEQITMFLNNATLNNVIITQFCEQFNIKLIKTILNKKELAQVTHIIVPKTKQNTCDMNFECLIGIANGLFIVNENWISDSLRENILMNCEKYEVNGTTSFIDCNGPKISRICKQKLNPKLFDGISIHIHGGVGWEQFSLENLKRLVLEFGAKLLKRMPDPEDIPFVIVPYHCQSSEEMNHVSTIILYTKDSTRLIKFNMKHLKTLPISWFMETIQKYSFG